VLALAYRFTGDREEALDVLQDTFLYLFGKFPGFTLTASLKAFLFPAVKHLCLTRRRGRRPEVDIQSLEEVLPAPDTVGLSDVSRLLAALPAFVLSPSTQHGKP
jgi:RNA polymerase sigma-70 factor (ECF subfamily)